MLILTPVSTRSESICQICSHKFSCTLSSNSLSSLEMDSTYHSIFLITAASSLTLLPIFVSLLYMSFLNTFSPLHLSDLLITHLVSAYRFVIHVLLAPKYSIHSNADWSDMDCPICLSQVEDGKEVTELRCTHVFHKVCLESWFAQKITCPICRCQINSCHRLEKGENVEEMMIIHLKLMQPRDSRRTRDQGDNFWLR